ncbi:MAG: hypothetical protein ACPG80_00650, partial [Rickettsiales bacterium]
REIGVGAEKTSVVINRSGARFKEAVTERDYERVCGEKIKFALANDTKSVVTAENQGKTILEVGQSQLSQQFKDLAGYLISLRDGTPYQPAAEAPKAQGLTSLFTRK